MVNEKLLTKPYEQYVIREKVPLICDYCGCQFDRVKKSIPRVNKIINKDSCGQNECKNQKQKEVNLKLYGSENYFTTEEFKEKQSAATLEKFGCETYFSSEDFKNKRSATMLEKYGGLGVFDSEVLRKKQEATSEKIYGVKNYAQHPDYKIKRKEFHEEHPEVMEKVLEDRKKTSLERYGVEHYIQSEEYWKERIATCLDKYGVEHPSQLKENREKAKKTLVEKYGVDNYSKSGEFKERVQRTCLEKWGVSCALLKNKPGTKSEIEISSWLESFGYIFKSNYTILDGKEIDLFNDDLKFGIEYCGLYWHTEVSPEPRNKKYHYDKFNKCRLNNIQLITLFEDEWKKSKDKCKNVIKSKLGIFDKRIYARNCEIREIDKKVAKKFYDDYHLLGGDNNFKISFGLFYEEKLVAIVSLGQHHRGVNKNQITLSRLCFEGSLQIIGGASRLFSKCKEWAKNNNYDSIISWSDNRWSTGKVYEKLGFIMEEELKPDYSYVDLHKGTRHNKQTKTKKKIGCPKEVKEHIWALEVCGLARIWDCGKKRWVYFLN